MELVQSFLLSVTRVKLSVYEQRIITKIVEHGQAILKGLSSLQYKHVKNPYGNETVTVEMRYLLNGTKDYRKVLDACKSLMNRQFEFYDPAKRTYYADTIIHNVHHTERSGKVSFMVSRIFFEVMYNFTLGYKRYDLENALTLPTPFAVRLYVLLDGQDKPITWSVDELKKMFGVQDKYKQTADFIKKVIEPARKAIMEHGCNHFTYSRVYEGQKVTHLRFFPVKVQKTESAWKEMGKDGIVTYKALRMYLVEYCGFTHKECDSNLRVLQQFATMPQAMEQLQVIDHRARKKNAGKAYIIGAMKSTIKEFNESVSKLPRKLREQVKEFQQLANEQK